MEDDLFSALMRRISSQTPSEHRDEIDARLEGADQLTTIFIHFASEFAEASLAENEKRYMDISMGLLFLSGVLPEMLPSADHILDASNKTWDAFTERLREAVDPDQFRT